MPQLDPSQIAAADQSAESPPKYWAAVTPSDTVDFATSIGTDRCRALWIGIGGDIVVVDLAGTATLLKNVASGYLLVGFFTRVNATNTTATDIVAAW